MPLSSDGDAVDFIYGVVDWHDEEPTMEIGAGHPGATESYRETAPHQEPASPLSSADGGPFEELGLAAPHRHVRGKWPFAAFVVDDETGEMLKELALQFGFAPELVVRGGISTALKTLSHARSPAILVVDISRSMDPLDDLDKLAELCDQDIALLVLGETNRIDFCRALREVGVRHYFAKPCPPELLREALGDALLNISRIARGEAERYGQNAVPRRDDGRDSIARAPFQAFVADDDIAGLLRSIADERGLPPDQIYLGGMGRAAEVLSVSASPSILFVDLASHPEPLKEVDQLAQICAPGTRLIVAGVLDDVALYQEMIASGLVDYLPKPISRERLADAVGAAVASLAAQPTAKSRDHRSSPTFAVIGTRGGVGASTIAISLAWLLGDKANRSTALLDLDVHFGTGALALDLEPGRGLTNAMENPGRVDGPFIERAMVRANDKLCVLSAEAPLSHSMLTDGSAFYQLQDELSLAFEGTVIDLPRDMIVTHPHLISNVQVVILVTELTLAATRDSIRLLSWLKAHAPHVRLIVVANKVLPEAQEVSAKDFEHSIECKVDIALPLNSNAAARAAKLGQPLAKEARSPMLTRPLEGLLALCLDDGSTPHKAGDVTGFSELVLGASRKSRAGSLMRAIGAFVTGRPFRFPTDGRSSRRSGS